MNSALFLAFGVVGTLSAALLAWDVRRWWRAWLAAPSLIIGSAEDPYLRRWRLLPKNRWINVVYLHQFLRDDEDRALHDHPWSFISWVLVGTYVEITSAGAVSRPRWSAAYRPATHRHRVVLPRDENGRSLSCWTLVFHGPRVREWGFWCPRGFVHWRDFTRPENPGEIGRGCDQ